MSKWWVYAICAGVLSVAAVQNVTVDDLDRSIVLSPLQVWSWSNEGTGDINGTFSFSNDGTANAFFTFPVPATAVYWQGFKRSGAALYSICIDCAGGPNDPKFQPVDGHDASAMPNDSVTTLFSKTGLSDTIHNLTIRNHLDPRFPGPSQITLDGFIITTSHNQAPETTNVPTMSMSMSRPAGPSITALNTPRNNSFLSTGSNTNILIGIAVACIVALIVAVVALLLCLRRRRMNYNRLSERRSGGGGGEISPMADTLEIMPNNAEQRNMVIRYEEPPISPQSDIYHKFPAPPQHFSSARQASGAYPSNHITSNTQPATAQQHHTHSEYDSALLEVPLLRAPKASQQHSSATTSSRTFSSYNPISISNSFARSSATEESDQHDVEREPMSPSERKRWYPSLLSQDAIDPGWRRPQSGPKPEPPQGRYPRDALSVASMASLRVSGIVEATQDAMTPGIEKTRFAQEGPPPKFLPPLGKRSSYGTPGNARSPSSSVFF